MGTFSRATTGVVIGGVSLALVLAAGGVVYQAVTGDKVAAEVKVPKERSYSVTVATLVPQSVIPVITSYGHVASGRTLEVRSAVAGPLIELSDAFHDGGAVKQGDILFRIDPAKLETTVALAETDVTEAEAELAEAKSALELARMEADVARQQRDLRADALTRQEGLRDRGISSAAEIEAATLAKAAAEQTLVNRMQLVAADEAKVDQAGITLDRRGIALKEAQRALKDATVSAPFAGVVTDVNAAAGRLVSANEKLATLLDPTALEVSFRVTNTQFARLLNASGDLRKADMTVASQNGQAMIEWPARLDRVGAETGDAQVGRLIYARLTEPDINQVRPGDFVVVKVPERPLENVAEIPASAATADGRMLLIGDGNRLEEVKATLLRQQGDTLIVGDVPFGRQYVEVRALQLGPGIQVQPVAAAAAPASETGAADAGAATPAAAPATDTMKLDDARRQKIIDFINASETMKPEMRDKFLEELGREDVPVATVEKFEAKMAEGQ